MKDCLKFLLVFFSFLAGCATCKIPQVTKEHPASPQAAISTAIEQKEILKADQSNLPDIPGEMKEKAMKNM